MRYIVLTSMMMLQLWAIDVVTSGNFEYSRIYCKPVIVGVPKDRKVVNRLELIVNNDVYSDKVDVLSSVGVITTDDRMYNNIKKDGVKAMRMVFVNDLYARYKLNSEWSVYGGVFSFRKGTFYEYGFNDYRLGNGIYGVITNELQGVLVKRATKEYEVLVGRLYSDKWGDMNIRSNMGKEAGVFKGTKVDTVIVKMKSERWYNEVNLYDIHKKIYGIGFGRTMIAALATSYDNEDVNGWLGYNTVSVSRTTGDNLGVSPTGKGFETPSVFVGSVDKVGVKVLVGARKTLDMHTIQREMVIGGEVGHIWDGYNDMTVGKPIEPYNYSLLGTTLDVYVGLRTSASSMVKLRYCRYYNNGKSYKAGNMPVSGNVDDMKKAGRGLDSITIQWYFDF